MPQIIDQNPPSRQDAASSLPPEPVKYPYSQKNLQACGADGASSALWNLRDLNKSLNPNLSALERQYWSWNFNHPGARAEDVPSRFIPVFDAIERQYEADNFQITDDKTERTARRINKEIDAELPGRNLRRYVDHATADYLERVISPNGPVAYERGGETCHDQPLEMVSKLRSCRARGLIGVKPNGEYLAVFDDKCGYTKLCPDESREESKRLAKKYIPVVTSFLKQHRGNTFQYMVLSLPNYPAGSLAFGKQDIFRLFTRLIKKKCCRNVAGWLVRQEDPLAADGGWNVHLNVLLLVDGEINWKEIRAEWKHNAHFESASSLTHKTRAKLNKRGIDTSKMGVSTVLVHAFNEILKYSGSAIAAKSLEKSGSGKTEAPPMTEWPDGLWREWWAANKGFRRTRTYGSFYDPEGYRWGVSSKAIRSEWVDKAGLQDSLSLLPWRKKGGSLTKDERGAIRKVMNEHEVLEMSLVKWIGSLLHVKGTGYIVSIDLIPEDKLGEAENLGWTACPEYPTGPPPDVPKDVDLMGRWDDYCNGII